MDQEDTEQKRYIFHLPDKEPLFPVPPTLIMDRRSPRVSRPMKSSEQGPIVVLPILRFAPSTLTGWTCVSVTHLQCPPDRWSKGRGGGDGGVIREESGCPSVPGDLTGEEVGARTRDRVLSATPPSTFRGSVGEVPLATRTGSYSRILRV